MTPELAPSKTLMRAAQADLERLRRGLARNEERQAQLRTELAALEKEREQLQDRDQLLQRLGADDFREPSSEVIGRSSPANHEVLRGAQVREHAARLFYQRYGAGEVRHYRQWFDLLVQSGVEVTGKDPMATFLTNLSRSPVVSRGSEAGTYAIDAEAPDRLRAQLGELHAELVDLAKVIARDEEPTQRLLDHRAELLSSIRKHERLLAEADRVLGSPADNGLAEAA